MNEYDKTSNAIQNQNYTYVEHDGNMRYVFAKLKTTKGRQLLRDNFDMLAKARLSARVPTLFVNQWMHIGLSKNIARLNPQVNPHYHIEIAISGLSHFQTHPYNLFMNTVSCSSYQRGWKKIIQAAVRKLLGTTRKTSRFYHENSWKVRTHDPTTSSPRFYHPARQQRESAAATLL